MEIRTYLSILKRFRWVILIATLTATTAAVIVDNVRTPVYQVQARLIVQAPSDIADPRDTGDLVGNLGTRAVTGTFAQFVNSEAVQDEARKAASLSREQASSYPITANPLPDSLVIEVRATGPNRTILTSYCNATVNAMVALSRSVYQVVDLAPLEMAQTPETPLRPNPLRDIPLATAFGLFLGLMIALAADYLSEEEQRSAIPIPERPSAEIPAVDNPVAIEDA